MEKILATILLFCGLTLFFACSNNGSNTGANNGQPQPGASVAAQPSASPTASPGNVAVRTGTWGGEHLRLTLASTTGTTEYDCGHGTIDEPFLTDSSGHFDLRGTHTFEHGGPVPPVPNPADTHPARYTGFTDGTSQMVITVILTDTQQNLGTFNPTYGSNGHIVKCL